MDFNFVNDKSEQIATGGNLAKDDSSQGITSAIKAAARELAGSSKGLNIAEFQRKYNIHILDIESLLED